jgi:hypothetical protein
MSEIDNKQDIEKPGSILMEAYGKPPAVLVQFGALLREGCDIQDTLASLRISHLSEHIFSEGIVRWSEVSIGLCFSA